MRERPHLVILRHVPAAVPALLREHARVTDVSDLPRAQWGAALGDALGVLGSSSTSIDAELVSQAPGLRIVAFQSVGYDNIDLEALRARGIVLTNARGSLVDAVADVTFWLVVAARRRFRLAVAWARDGRWMRGEAPFTNDVAGATLGIVGFGEIGPAVARRAQAAGMRVLYSNRTPRTDDAQTGASYRSFDALLGESDCVVALVPLTPQTHHMFDAAAFAKMKPTATFVNAARGAVCDTDALVRALEQKTIAGAALDVTDPEPLPPDHPLYAREDVVILPHVGSATVETRTRMSMLAAENLVAFVEGKPLLTPVAF